MSPASLRIAVFGQYKTGTTALYYQILAALLRRAVTLFEPVEYRPVPHDADKPVLAKVILGLFEGRDRVVYEVFLPCPRKVFILRDSRDRIVSCGLFVVQQSPRDHDHVVRTRRHGDWKNWFVEEDVAFFRSAIEPYLQHFGYDDDWALAENPAIPPEHASAFVLKTVDRRRGRTVAPLFAAQTRPSS